MGTAHVGPTLHIEGSRITPISREASPLIGRFEVGRSEPRHAEHRLVPTPGSADTLYREMRLVAFARALRGLSLAALSDAAARDRRYRAAGVFTVPISFEDDVEARRRATLRIRLHPRPVVATADREPIHA